MVLLKVMTQNPKKLIYIIFAFLELIEVERFGFNPLNTKVLPKNTAMMLNKPKFC